MIEENLQWIADWDDQPEAQGNFIFFELGEKVFVVAASSNEWPIGIPKAILREIQTRIESLKIIKQMNQMKEIQAYHDHSYKTEDLEVITQFLVEFIMEKED